MPKYRIIESHCGDPSEIYSTFTAENDEAAITTLKKEKAKPTNGYSYLWLERIDQEEKTTNIPIKD